MVTRDCHPEYRQRQHGSVDSWSAFEGGNAEYDHQRVHQNSLIPAECAGTEAQTEREIEAASGCDGRDDSPESQQPALVTDHSAKGPR